MKTLVHVLVMLVVLAAAAPARADTEWVLVLDNSNSMDDGATDTVTNAPLPPNDPDRLAVIATLVFRALMGPEDKLTILTFDSSRPETFKPVPNDANAVRGLVFDTLTFVVGPLREARRILEASTATRRILVFATDGSPSPETNGAEPIDADGARKLLGLDPGPGKFEVVALALSQQTQGYVNAMEHFLKPLGRYEFIADPAKLVAAFTNVYADSIRSRPETGRLSPGETYKFTVGKYVTELFVGIATERKSGPFTATLTMDGQTVNQIDSGDAGCKNPPCHAYQVFRTPHDPEKASELVLTLPAGARGPVAFGTIRKYDLQADLVSAPQKVKVGENLEVVARITWKGKTFNDPAFFKADGFTATLALGDVEVPLTVTDDGTFKGTLVVAGEPRTDRIAVRFKNQWISLADGREITVDAWAPLDLKIGALDFGSWTGGRKETRRCIEVSLAGSTNAGTVPIEAFADGMSGGYELEVERPLVVKDNKFEACVVAPGCCSESPKGVTMTVRGVDPHYHPQAVKVPMTFEVAPTPFLTCWWPYIAAGIGTIIFIIVVVGFVRPRDFDKEDLIRLAKTEQALTRAGGRRLRELPGGKRGFYRNARVAFDGGGNAVRATSGVSLILRAARGDPHVTAIGSLEEKDPRTRKFQPVDLSKGPIYLRRGIVYKLGEFVFRLG
jgi:hypothetical protein